MTAVSSFGTLDSAGRGQASPGTAFPGTAGTAQVLPPERPQRVAVEPSDTTEAKP